MFSFVFHTLCLVSPFQFILSPFPTMADISQVKIDKLYNATSLPGVENRVLCDIVFTHCRKTLKTLKSVLSVHR